MAGINLTPNVMVIIGQGFLYALAFGIVHRLIIKPYSKLRNRREEMIHGGTQDLSQIYAQIASRKKLMEESSQEVLSEVQSIRETSKEEALAAAKQEVKAAQEQADVQVAESCKKIAAHVAEQQSAFDSCAKELAHSLFERVSKG